MSVKLKNGKMTVVSELCMDAEEYRNRLKALLNLMDAAEEDNLNKDDMHYAIGIIGDMLPTFEQAKRMFET